MKNNLLEASRVAAQALRNGFADAEAIAETSRFIRAGGHLTVQLLDAVYECVQLRAHLNVFLAPSIAKDDEEAASGDGDQQLLDATLALLFALVCSPRLSDMDENNENDADMFLKSKIGVWISDGSLFNVICRPTPSVALSDEQRERAIASLHRIYLIVPPIRRSIREQLTRVVTLGATVSTRVSVNPNDASQLTKLHAASNARARLLGRGGLSQEDQAALAAVATGPQAYADDDMVRALAPLKVILRFLEAIFAGCKAIVDTEYETIFNQCTLLLELKGKIDDLTSLMKVYVGELAPCLVAGIRRDPSGELCRRVIRTIATHAPVASSKTANLLWHTLEKVIECAHNERLPLGRTHRAIVRLLTSKKGISNMDYTLAQRCLLMLDNDNVLDLVVNGSVDVAMGMTPMNDDDDDDEGGGIGGTDESTTWSAQASSQQPTLTLPTASKTKKSYAQRLAQSIVRAYNQATFSKSLKLMCHRALQRLIPFQPSLATWAPYVQIDKQCRAEQALQEAIKAERRRKMLLPHDNLSFMKLAWNKTLGTGVFGTVRSALYIEQGVAQSLWPEFAIKTIQNELLSDESIRKSLDTEIRVLRQCTSPTIVRFIGSFSDEKRTYVAMELAERGDLYDVVRKLGSVDVAYAQYVSANVAHALAYLHGCGIVHNDVKPENVLIAHDGFVKLGDLGSAVYVDELSDEPRTLTGTPEYVAYEMAADALRRDEATDAGDDSQTALYCNSSLLTPLSDWWSFGCVLYQMLHGRPPFIASRAAEASPREVLRHVVKLAPLTGAPLSADTEETRVANKCIRSLLQCDVQRRYVPYSGDDEEMDAFFRFDKDRTPPVVEVGHITAGQVDVKVKGRKFSMMWTSVTQMSPIGAERVVLDVIEEIEGF